MKKIIRSGLKSTIVYLGIFGSSLVQPAISAEGKYDPLPPPKEGTLSWDLEQGMPYWVLPGTEYTSRIRACKDRREIEEIQKVLVAHKGDLKRGVELGAQLSDRLVSEHKCVVFPLPIDYTIVEITSTNRVVNISPDPALTQKRMLGMVEIKINGSQNLFMSVMLPYDVEFSI
ncbi:hypothetical protein HZC00_02850 [Candidatus Kaiserbacteria bacterium]|nr:hypothetical protein [Candidatus Kaiserbacteria bacterium]